MTDQPMTPPPTIRFSHGFNCFIIESSVGVHYFDAVEDIQKMLRWVQSHAINHHETHSALDHTVPEDIKEFWRKMREPLIRRFVESGGQVTTKGVKLKVDDFLDLEDLT